MLSSLIKNSKKPFPAFITGSKFVKANLEVEKIFPEIGLPNFSEPCKVKLDTSQLRMDKFIHLAIQRFLHDWNNNHCLADLRKTELLKMSHVIYILEELNRRFAKNSGIGIIDNKVVLTISIPNFDGKPLVKKGIDLFKLVNSLLEYANKYVSVQLFDTKEVAKQLEKVKLVFSSSGIVGAWDLATMSMRGIKSCMRWDHPSSLSLLGSIVDPYCGIIYLTNNGKTSHGSKMLYRSIVRLAFNYNNKPVLMVDRIYSTFYKTKPEDYSKFDESIKKYFIQALAKKVSYIEIVDTQKVLADDYYLPSSVNIQGYLHETEKSYRDAKVPYSGIFQFKDVVQTVMKN